MKGLTNRTKIYKTASQLNEPRLNKKKKKKKRENKMFEMAKFMNPFVSPEAEPDYVIEVLRTDSANSKV